MSQLMTRVLTAVPMLIGLLLLLFAVPASVAVWITAALMVVAAWEWSAFLGWREPVRRIGYAIAVALVLAVARRLVPETIGLRPLLWLALFWWGIALAWILRYPTPVPTTLAALAGVLVLVPAWLALVSTLSIPVQGPWLALLALGIIVAADIGAYFAGRRFGRVKLAPRVSPGKTWEGVVGGAALATLAAGAGGALLGFSPAVMMPLGLGVAALSVVGDLTESMFKRSIGAKDSSHLIPGHGGILDRLDSVTAALPLFALAMSWLGLMAG